MNEILQDPFHALLSLMLLTCMEIILGIDNIIFISILSGKLPREHQQKARTIGMSFAFIFRSALLLSITWIISLTAPLFYLGKAEISWRDLILFAGGIFLIYNATMEIVEKLRGHEENDGEEKFGKKTLTVTSAILQIVLIDIIFSFDSILTAVGLIKNVVVMILAVLISLVIMLKFSKAIGDYINGHPNLRMMALAFLVMIGILLVIEAVHQEVHKSYVYFAMAYAVTVEFINMRARKVKANSHHLHKEEESVH